MNARLLYMLHNCANHRPFPITHKIYIDLKRVIQKEVQDPLARLLLQGDIKDGDAIRVSAEAGVLVINGVAVSEARPVSETVN